jgi:hypothetical protein
MAIKKEFKSGNQIGEGEHVVKITKVEVGNSKKGEPMLTLTFERADEARMKGYYVKSLKFHMKQLDAVKIACGLTAIAPNDELQGKKLGIAVELDQPNENGIRFGKIIGYGKWEDVEAADDFSNPKSSADKTDQIPW